MKIGFFDSGIGGLSVLHTAMKMLPGEQFIYYADTDHVPYGEKSPEEVMRFTVDVMDFMVEHDVKAVVIACNTATSVSVRDLRKRYKIPIIGMEPAIKKAIDLYGDKRVLATATPITVRGEKMKCLMEKVDKQHLVDLVPLPGLVRFAENGEFESEAVKKYLKSEFAKFDFDQYASLVLGCTHFNYFKESFRSVIPEHIHFVDGIEGTIHELMRKLPQKILGDDRELTVDYFDSGIAVDSVRRGEIERYHRQLERMLDYE